MSYWHINQAVQVLNQGGVICYPTESVYGLGCNPTDLTAVLQILDLKKRQINKGLILVAENVAQLEPYIDISDTLTFNKLIDSVKSGKVITWVVPCTLHTPMWLTGDYQSIAVRISSHPIVRQLCKQFDAAIVSTSANISGQASARHHWLARKRFAKLVDYYVPGELGLNATESEIRDIITDEIIRA